MNRPLRIAVADSEREMRDFFARVLPRLGHEIVVAATTGRELIERCRTSRPDLVILDIRLPDVSGLQALDEVCSGEPVPAIVVSAPNEQDLVQPAESSYVMAYLVKPVKQVELAPAIALAMRRFEQIESLKRETSQLRQTLDDRKVIERAKGLIVTRLRIDEASAFRHLQKLAMDSSRKLAEVARQVVADAEKCPMRDVE